MFLREKPPSAYLVRVLLSGWGAPLPRGVGSPGALADEDKRQVADLFRQAGATNYRNVADLWRQHEAYLLSEAQRLQIKPVWYGHYFGAHIARQHPTTP